MRVICVLGLPVVIGMSSPKKMDWLWYKYCAHLDGSYFRVANLVETLELEIVLRKLGNSVSHPFLPPLLFDELLSPHHENWGEKVIKDSFCKPLGM